MKHFIRQLKIKHKLIIIIMTTVVVSLLLAGSVLIVSERYLAKQSMVDKLMTISRIIADRSTAALSFNDEQVAREVLSALDNESSVILGCIYDETQTIFAAHGSQDNAKCPESPAANGYKFWGERFELYQVVMLEGDAIGTVYILATLDKLNERILTFVILVLIMVVVIGGMAYFLAKRQQEIISKPIVELTEVTREISINGDYSTRLPLRGEDEIGSLNLAFNDMLETIDKRQKERDKAEKALSEREQDLVVTLNSIGDAVIVTDLNGHVTRMNPVAERLTGWTFEESFNKTIDYIFPIINEATNQPIANPVEEVVSTGKTVFLSNHTTLITREGKRVHIADSAAPIRNVNNEILGMILVFNDVTEQYKLREAAAKSKRDLQAIMDNSPAAIHVEDAHGKVIFFNQRFVKLFHIDDVIENKTINNLFEKTIGEKMQQFNDAVLSTGNVLEIEEVVPYEDGEYIYSSIKFPLYDEDNNIYAVCSISTDITDRRQQEEKLRRSQKMDALGKLTGGIAHDYNNLLGIIIGYAELLNDKLTNNPDLVKYTSGIEHAAERGAKLTKKLLSFTRHKSEDENLLDINELINDQQLMLGKTLTARITLKMDLVKNIWPVWVDGGDLEDAIINMCINASHAIKGNGEIIFKTENKIISEIDAGVLHLDKGDYVLLTIIDSGSGMDKSIREKIFDPFFSTKGDGGTGLGLSQVYGFVKRSGGDIKVHSEPGQGTQFELYFPRSKQSAFKEGQASSVKKEKYQGGEIILVVDDEPALVDLAKDILVNQGYCVLTANSGAEALTILKDEKVDLIVSDVIMPTMDGYQLAEKVHKAYANIKIQLVSGFAGGRDDHITDKNLQDNILYKPYTSGELLQCIRRLFDGDEGHEYSAKSSDKVDVKISKQKKSEEQATSVNDTEKNLNITPSNKNTILIMDDEEDVRDLFVLSLEMLGYDTLTANDSSEAINIYKASLENGNKISAIILDLNIPGSMRGEEVALEIRKISNEVKLIVCSGDSLGEEMINYKSFGFDGALEKTFNRKNIKQLLDKLLK